MRYGGGAAIEPITPVDIYVDAALSQLSWLTKTLDVPVYTMLEEQYGIKVTRVEQEVQGLPIEAPKPTRCGFLMAQPDWASSALALCTTRWSW